MAKKTEELTFSETELVAAIHDLCVSAGEELQKQCVRTLDRLTLDERVKFATSIKGEQSVDLLGKMILIAAADSPVIDRAFGAEAYVKVPGKIRRLTENRMV